MGLSRLNIFVSEVDDPCCISNGTWYVSIFKCDGKVLEWCDKRYLVMKAPCGHLEVDVPPGCYYIRAVAGYRITSDGTYVGNLFTDAAIVQVCCHSHVCVTLFQPSIHRCGPLYSAALGDLAQTGRARGAAQRVGEVVEQVAKETGADHPKFELAYLKEIEAARREER